MDTARRESRGGGEDRRGTRTHSEAGYEDAQRIWVNAVGSGDDGRHGERGITECGERTLKAVLDDEEEAEMGVARGL